MSTSTSAVAATYATPYEARYLASEVEGAEGVVHTHPTSVDAIVPGSGDWAQAARGIPNYVAHGTRSVVVEISGGQVRVRVISGHLSTQERRDVRSRLREFQVSGVGH